MYCSPSCLNLSNCSFAQGSNATGDCCSKCWGEQSKKNQDENNKNATQSIQSQSPKESPEKLLAVEKPADSMAIVEESSSAAQSPAKSTPTAPKKKTKKKKKTSYKDMMSTMMTGNSNTRDIEKEKNDLRKVTGGGAFSKVEKI